jgi:hypothetical protein
MPAIASLEDLKAAQKDLLEAKNLNKLKTEVRLNELIRKNLAKPEVKERQVLKRILPLTGLSIRSKRLIFNLQSKRAKRSISALPCATGLLVCTLQNMSFTGLIEPDTEKIFLMNLLRNLPNTMLADVGLGNYTTIGLSIGHIRKFCGQRPQN